MKRRTLKKSIRTYAAIVLAGLMMLSGCGQTADVTESPNLPEYTEEEIAARIREVGRDYDGIDRDDGLLNLLGISGGNGYYATNSAPVMYEATACDAEAGVEMQVSSPVAPIDPDMIVIDQPWDTEGYNPIDESGFVNTSTNRFSTFGADVDTATYSNFRRTVYENYYYFKHENDYPIGGLDASALRIEEMINYFQYSYPEVEDGEKFSVSQTVVPCPWNDDTLLYRVGVRAEKVDISGGSNIVFLVDTSGSMFWNNGLPLAQEALKILLENLGENDRISIVTYAGSQTVLLEGVSGDEHDEIEDAIDDLEAGGGTNGAGGIIKAYEIAQKYFIEGGNNRVILCTDGDFNLGTTSEADLVSLIEEKRETGVFLSCLGFGVGNYKDDKMEALADHGNGNYFYIDCTAEAEKALKNEIWSTLYTVAKDTKFQVEFNPETVAAYRIIGYENRQMATEDFSNDAKDGGEVGSGQTVTILYEIVPVGSDFDLPTVDSRYGSDDETSITSADEFCVLNIRYKEPTGTKSELRTYPVTTSMLTEKMDYDTSWAAGVAQVGMIYRGSQYAGTSDYQDVIDRLSQDPSVMTDDYKAQFLYIVGMLEEME